MRKFRDNILRITTALDMFASSILLVAYACTDNVIPLMIYAAINLVLLLIVVCYSLDLTTKRQRMERAKKHIGEMEEKDI